MKTITRLLVVSSIAASMASCVDKDTYYSIDRAVEKIAAEITERVDAGTTDEDELVHFYGGIVRMGEVIILCSA